MGIEGGAVRRGGGTKPHCDCHRAESATGRQFEIAGQARPVSCQEMGHMVRQLGRGAPAGYSGGLDLRLLEGGREGGRAGKK